MKRIQLGDLFEINTLKGKAYFQYIYKDEKIGELIRVFSGLFKERPDDLKKIADAVELYQVFFPLGVALKRGIIENVGNYSGCEFKKPQYMRVKNIVKGNFLGWYIIDTETWSRQLVNELSDEEKELSPWGIWNDVLLVECLEKGWNLKNW